MKSADEVLYVPVEEIVEESIGKATFRPNPRSKKRRFLEEPAIDFYGGFENFLVRTALIRASDYDDSKAPTISDPQKIFPLVQHLAYADQEHFVVIAVNNQMKLLAIHEAAIGGTSSAAVELKQALKVAFLTSASACFVVHNHPGGRSEPSSDDVVVSRKIKEGMDCVGIRLIDSLIISRSGLLSLYERGDL